MMESAATREPSANVTCPSSRKHSIWRCRCRSLCLATALDTAGVSASMDLTLTCTSLANLESSSAMSTPL
uniref:Uncharacterized protein n=1 Tax=Zea mays TaxID=4577 RepID=C4J5B9_MAIZE|nr:unknown [Zea mays]